LLELVGVGGGEAVGEAGREGETDGCSAGVGGVGFEGGEGERLGGVNGVGGGVGSLETCIKPS